MPIHAARLALTRSVTQKAVDPSMGPALRVRALRHARRPRALTRGRPGAPGRPGTGRSRRTARREALSPAALRRAGRAACAARRRLAAPRYTACFNPPAEGLIRRAAGGAPRIHAPLWPHLWPHARRTARRSSWTRKLAGHARAAGGVRQCRRPTTTTMWSQAYSQRVAAVGVGALYAQHLLPVAVP